MKTNLIFVDAESDGLYGTILSVGMKVVNQHGEILESRYYGLSQECLRYVQTAWVREHVLPIMGAYEECASETELLRKVWSFWMKYKEDAYMIGDVIYPVEARLLSECVKLNPEKNTFEAPYPLLDLSAMLFAKGIDPLAGRYELLGKTVSEFEHNPMKDVDISIALWEKYIRE